tara:strand:- start:765 stop:869 length:105 start_codon:yes stop_codon:yes gene_type:complete
MTALARRVRRLKRVRKIEGADIPDGILNKKHNNL